MAKYILRIEQREQYEELLGMTSGSTSLQLPNVSWIEIPEDVEYNPYHITYIDYDIPQETDVKIYEWYHNERTGEEWNGVDYFSHIWVDGTLVSIYDIDQAQGMYHFLPGRHRVVYEFINEEASNDEMLSWIDTTYAKKIYIGASSGDTIGSEYYEYRDERPYCGLSVEEIEIGYGVRRILSNCLYNNDNLRTLRIPSTLTYIQYRIGNTLSWPDCLCYNYNLENIIVDELNPVYDSREGCNCIIETATNKIIRAGGNFRIPSSVQTIGYQSFADLENITELHIPDNITKIEARAFQDMINLSVVTLPAALEDIECYAFYGCRSLPQQDGLVYADTYCVGVHVDGQDMTEFYPRQGTKFIGGQIFYLLNPAGGSMRTTNKITTVHIPSSVVNICKFMLYNYYGTIQSFIVDTGNTHYTTYGTTNILAEVSTGTLINALTNITDIPEGIRHISEKSIIKGSATAMTSLNFPTTFEGMDLPISTDDSYRSITQLTVTSGNPRYHSDSNCIIETATNKLVLGCKGSIIPNYVETIGEYAFIYAGLTSVTIPDSVETIEQNAFYNCMSLQYITIGTGIKRIESGAFAYFEATKRITINAVVPPEIENASVFSFGRASYDIYVPAQSVETYKTASVWRDVRNIDTRIKPIA